MTPCPPSASPVPLLAAALWVAPLSAAFADGTGQESTTQPTTSTSETAAAPAPSPSPPPDWTQAWGDTPPPRGEGSGPRSENGGPVGSGLVIAGGVLGGLAAVLNGVRTYVVVFPCQTASQQGCTGGWFASGLAAATLNVAAIPLAAVGAGELGVSAQRRDPERHRERAQAMAIAGPILIGLGVAGTIGMRTIWLVDYATPKGPELLDFAQLPDAAAYYGTLQLSAWSVVTGIALVTYARARPGRRSAGMTPIYLRGGVAVGWSGRF